MTAEQTAPACTAWCTTSHDGPGGWDSGHPIAKTCVCPIRSGPDLDVRLERFTDTDHAEDLVVRIVADVLLTPLAVARLLSDVTAALLAAA